MKIIQNLIFLDVCIETENIKLLNNCTSFVIYKQKKFVCIKLFSHSIKNALIPWINFKKKCCLMKNQFLTQKIFFMSTKLSYSS
jgi:hypothetical protein